ncbi:hydrogenase nickel incorporation protein HypB [Corynebacterium xerosis]|uniref:Hydrogenase nickel incorporation protein HypB n=1 Tax=Corynebacterium xerosis TaxID=1725 RepID=A0ABV3USZ6_9CORY|nr:hydrogenase nickel incorporation protein HypB [Corynebacterium xerosis]AYJ33690.1 hydrogenase accessory protein HypB [Corynebacterium xerosis]
MGRFHRHDDGTVHAHHHHHDDHHHDHAHDHDHGDHSGYDTGRERVQILEDIFTENDVRAAENRALFDEHGVTAVNVMSSPGSGKTALLRHALEDLRGKVRVGVIEGDIETPLDAERLEGFGAQISLLNTGNGFGGECHLDAPMISSALRGLDLAELDLVFIENVGNLVCPAEFEVGEHRKMMVYAVTEGEDKPLKYPVMFRSVEAVVVNKIDLLPYLDFDMDLFLANLRKVNPGAKVFEASAKTGEGLGPWLEWLLEGNGRR